MKRVYGLDEDTRPVRMGEKVLDLRSGRSGKIITLPLANSLWATMLADNGRAYLVSLDKLEPVGDDGQADRPKPAPDPHLDHAGGKFAERLAEDRDEFNSLPHQPALFGD